MASSPHLASIVVTLTAFLVNSKVFSSTVGDRQIFSSGDSTGSAVSISRHLA